MGWQSLLSENITTAEELRDILQLPQEKYEEIREEIQQFPMSVTKYYLSLIDPDDPADPIRRMAVPSTKSVMLDGELDTSGEHSNTKMAGLQHKYVQSALVLTTSQCAMYCRHCFRRRLVGVENEETTANVDSVVTYLEENPGISNILLSGGDAFLLTTEKIEEWLSALCDLPQLDFIRFGTRTPVTFPQRILEDPALTEVLARYVQKKQIYVMTHFNHPREFSEKSRKAVRALQKAGAVVKNQAVLLRGVNDDPEILGQLLKNLTENGIVAHYIFQCRPVKGVKTIFQVPLGEGLDIVQKANAMQNGLGKAADYTMSHITGKIRILGKMDDGRLIFQYKQAKDPAMIGKMMAGDVADLKWLPDNIDGCLSKL